MRTRILLALGAAVIAVPSAALAGPPATSGLSVGDASVAEGNSATTTVQVPVRLSAAAKKDVAFSYQTRSGTAVAPGDFQAVTGNGIIRRGTTQSTILVNVVGDTAVEADETFEVLITSVTNASLKDGLATVSITNDDVPPPPDPFGWAPPAGSLPATGTAVYLQSNAGDYVGQGRTYTYTKANSLLSVTTSGGRVTVGVHGDERWSADFAEPSANTSVQAGYFTGLGRYPFNVPGLTWSGEGRGCNTVAGRFIVDQISYSGSQPSTLTLRFEQRCDNSAGSLFGYIRYDATDPTSPPPPGDPAQFAWRAPVDAVSATGSYLYFESSTGDWVGKGATRLYTDGVTASDSNGVVHLRVESGSDWWFGDFSGPDAQTQLAVGHYADLQRYPFHNPVEGGLSFSGNGAGCNTVTGSFAADDATYDAAGLASVTVRFVQHCDGGPALYGQYHWVR